MIGILGGTFDPVHYGHLRPALELLHDLRLEHVRFVPCGTPPHRPEPMANADQRLAMLTAAVGDQPGFRIDTRELRHAAPSYTYNTLTALRAEVGDTPLCLIIGMDAFHGLDTWYRWEELIGLMCRAGFVIEDLVEPLHAKQDAEVGSFGHRSQYAAPYVRIKARRLGPQLPTLKRPTILTP